MEDKLTSKQQDMIETILSNAGDAIGCISDVVVDAAYLLRISNRSELNSALDDNLLHGYSMRQIEAHLTRAIALIADSLAELAIARCDEAGVTQCTAKPESTK